MLKRFLSIINRVFESLKQYWENKKSLHLISIILVLTFIVSSLISVLVINDFISLGSFDKSFKNPFFSIEIVFTILLIVELFGLIFVLPKSVANSVGKQFELLSLIFLRDAFKEFSHFGNNLEWLEIKDSFINMMIYGFGAIIVFSIIGLNNKIQQHIKLTSTGEEQTQFIRLKKLLALALLIAFTIIGFRDLKVLIESGTYLHSFQDFYTILVFSDILIVLFALRFTINYYKIFRYSAFVLATILIRLSLSLYPYYDVLVGVIAALFVLALTVTYNYFLKNIPDEKLD
jgi:hypothetical protein